MLKICDLFIFKHFTLAFLKCNKATQSVARDLPPTGSEANTPPLSTPVLLFSQ